MPDNMFKLKIGPKYDVFFVSNFQYGQIQSLQLFLLIATIHGECNPFHFVPNFVVNFLLQVSNLNHKMNFLLLCLYWYLFSVVIGNRYLLRGSKDNVLSTTISVSLTMPR